VTNVVVLAGVRQFDEDDWDPVDLQRGYGIEIDSRRPEQAVGFEFGTLYSSEQDDVNDVILGDVDVEASFWEIYGGVRKTWDSEGNNLKPYLAGGLALINVDAEVDPVGMPSASDDDTSLGIYLHGGVQWDVANGFLLGLDLRTLIGTDIDLGGYSGDVDYVQLALLLGYSF
jgi:opacity protein-like surface antigen